MSRVVVLCCMLFLVGCAPMNLEEVGSCNKKKEFFGIDNKCCENCEKLGFSHLTSVYQTSRWGAEGYEDCYCINEVGENEQIY